MTGDASTTKSTYQLKFTENMRGFFTFGEADYQRGFENGHKSRSALMFHLTIETDDTYAFIADPTHVALVKRGYFGSDDEGSSYDKTDDIKGSYVKSDLLGGSRPVEYGEFNLFVDAGEINDEPARHMRYRLWFNDAVGHPLTLIGIKDIRHPDAALSRFRDVWGETSTLYTKILAGHVKVGGDDDASLVGAGIIHILPLDFAYHLTTFRVSGPKQSGRWRAFQAFGALFMGQLWEVFQPRLPWPIGH